MTTICFSRSFRIRNTDMRAQFAALTILLPLIASCDQPAATDYWQRSAAAPQACVSKSKQFESAMAQGTRANLAGQPDDAVKLFREALKDQQTAYPGADNPCLALPRMSLAVQLSAAGQYADAEGQFADAERSLANTNGSEMKPRELEAMHARLLHYEGIHLLNQGKFAEADVKLHAAQDAYTDPNLEPVSFEALHSEPVVRPVRNKFDATSSTTNEPDRPKILSANRIEQPSLLGLIEVLRYRAIALRHLDQLDEAAKLSRIATRLARSNDLGRPSVLARLFLTSGLTASKEEARFGGAGGGELAQAAALRDYVRSDTAFDSALPRTKPSAEAALIHAAELYQAGKTSAAASLCRRAVETLHTIGAGTTPDLMTPCLDAYAANGSNDEDMFVAAQIAQGTITSHQIAQASAALAESKHNPAIGKALQDRDRAQRLVEQIYRELDTMGSATAGPAAARVALLQQQVEQAQTELAQAEQAVRAASPNFSQLVQDVVPASAVYQSLHPNEAFIGFFLSRSAGWVFVLRDGHMSKARIEGGTATIDPLVAAVRKGLDKTDANSLPVFDIDNTRRLYSLTVGAVSDSIKGAKALVIAPTGRLLSLPFEVMLTGPADGAKLADAPWLVRQATITHVPAATNFVSLRKVANSSAATKPWFGFGDFHVVSGAQAARSFPPSQCGQSAVELAGLPALPGAVKELETARGVLGAAQGDELLGDSFTAEKVLSTSLKDYRILHFAAHAILPSDLRCQSEAAIVTSPPPGAADAGGALLKASQLLDLDLDANLVILSACNSGGPGGGAGGAGESLSGLARSFFYARARSMLVTHWDVSDQAAALLVVLTINGMKEKPEEGVTGALRHAQLSLLEKASAGTLPAEIAHPFFWAPFAVIGDGGEGGARSTVSSRL
jgi:CHAT domain-containing protein